MVCKLLFVVLVATIVVVNGAVDDFQIIAENLGNVIGVTFINTTHGLLVGQERIQRTMDGGYTWKIVEMPDKQTARYHDITSSGEAVVASGNGDSNLMPGTSYSLNAGVWFNKTDETHQRQKWYSVEPIPGHTGSFVKTGEWTDWSTTSQGVATSSNGGKSWTDHEWSIDTPAKFASFISSAKGWVAGGESPDFFDTNKTRAVIAVTSDGGWTWTKLTDVTSYYHNGIAFVSDSTGWVTCVTSSGSMIMKTTNGGVSWTTQVTMDKVKLQKIRMFSTTEGWAVGGYQDGLFYHGMLLHTTDGGTSWSSYAKRGIILNDVDGFNNANVYATGVSESGSGGVLLKWVKS